MLCAPASTSAWCHSRMRKTFQRDSQAPTFTLSRCESSGMGLAISQSIVESHGGRIWANCAGGLGATFHFTLPPVPAEAGTPIVAQNSAFPKYERISTI